MPEKIVKRVQRASERYVLVQHESGRFEKRPIDVEPPKPDAEDSSATATQQED